MEQIIIFMQAFLYSELYSLLDYSSAYIKADIYIYIKLNNCILIIPIMTTQHRGKSDQAAPHVVSGAIGLQIAVKWLLTPHVASNFRLFCITPIHYR